MAEEMRFDDDDNKRGEDMCWSPKEMSLWNLELWPPDAIIATTSTGFPNLSQHKNAARRNEWAHRLSLDTKQVRYGT
jgi:hypothetical protein